MCSPIGCGFLAVLLGNRVLILVSLVLNRVSSFGQVINKVGKITDFGLKCGYKLVLGSLSHTHTRFFKKFSPDTWWLANCFSRGCFVMFVDFTFIRWSGFFTLWEKRRRTRAQSKNENRISSVFWRSEYTYCWQWSHDNSMKSLCPVIFYFTIHFVNTLTGSWNTKRLISKLHRLSSPEVWMPRLETWKSQLESRKTRLENQ